MTSEFKKQRAFEELVEEFRALSNIIEENFILFLEALAAIEAKLGKGKK